MSTAEEMKQLSLIYKGTEDKPFYRKVQQTKPSATPLFIITCDEGWRESIVCDNMYEWAADWLIEQIQGKPYHKARRERIGK